MTDQDQDQTPQDAAPIGYGNPPEHSRFKPGTSGNPHGRPRGRTREAPYESVLGRTVKVIEDDKERQVTAAEAFMLHLAKRGLEGDNAAARALIRAIEDVRKYGVAPQDQVTAVVWKMVAPGSVTSALELLQMADLIDEFSAENARVQLRQWIVDAALERFDRDRLSDCDWKFIRGGAA